jgi:hypothetical protein
LNFNYLNVINSVPAWVILQEFTRTCFNGVRAIFKVDPIYFSSTFNLSRRILVRNFRIAVAAAGLFLLLAGQVHGHNTVQINYRVGSYETGAWPTGQNVSLFLGDKFGTGGGQRVVKNDCAPTKRDGTPLPVPDVGYWFFHPHSIDVLNCGGKPLVGAKGRLRRDYNHFSRHAIMLGCRMMRHEGLRLRNPPIRPYSCAYRYWKSYRGDQGRNVLIRPCHGSKSPHRLHTAVFASNGVTYRKWCDGLQKPPF